jgi:hypothetical protein
LIFIFACCTHVDRKNYTPFFPSNQGVVIYLVCGKFNKVYYFF